MIVPLTRDEHIAELDDRIEYLSGQLEQWHPDSQAANRQELAAALAELDRLLDEQEVAAPPEREGGGGGNRVTLTGTLRARPQPYHYADHAGLTSVTFQIGVPTRRTTPDGTALPGTDAYRCVAWGATADALVRRLVPGTVVTVHGRLQIEGRVSDTGHTERCVSIRVQHFTAHPPAAY